MEMSVTLGSHTSQTPMELLGFLIGLRVCVSFFRRRQRIPVVKVDSGAALGSPLKLSSPRPSMNFIAAELVLLLETEDIVEGEGSHVPEKLNVNADYLSRPPLKLPPPPAGTCRGKHQEGQGLGPVPAFWAGTEARPLGS